MRLHSKVIAATISAAIAVSAISAPAAAQQNQQQRTSILPTLVAPFAAGALLPATSTFHWTTIATKTWVYPWKGFVGGALQGVNATGQYIHNVIDPKYFNETLHIDNFFHKKSGVHSTSADYKKANARTSKNVAGKIVVGCIFGSALGAITASIRKATAMGNPPRWRSQAEHERILASGVEKKYELTNAEASTATALCGAGSFLLRWPQQPV